MRFVARHAFRGALGCLGGAALSALRRRKHRHNREWHGFSLATTIQGGAFRACRAGRPARAPGSPPRRQTGPVSSCRGHVARAPRPRSFPARRKCSIAQRRLPALPLGVWVAQRFQRCDRGSTDTTGSGMASALPLRFKEIIESHVARAPRPRSSPPHRLLTPPARPNLCKLFPLPPIHTNFISFPPFPPLYQPYSVLTYLSAGRLPLGTRPLTPQGEFLCPIRMSLRNPSFLP